MEKATVSQIKKRLSAYLEKVRAGESVLIIDHDGPIARLEGVSSEDQPDDRLARLERAGLVRRASTALDVQVLRGGAPHSRVSVLGALTDDRLHDR